MALTEFGKAVRKARIDVRQTQASMAAELCASPSFLSAMENGKKPISDQWLVRIERFFAERGLKSTNFRKLAALSNCSVTFSGLPLPQQALIAELAHSTFTHEELSVIADLVTDIKLRRIPSGDKPARRERAGWV